MTSSSTPELPDGPIPALHLGNKNAPMIYDTMRLFLPLYLKKSVRDHAVVADVTWGKGAFWRVVEKDPDMCNKIELWASDISPDAEKSADGRTEKFTVCGLDNLPYDDSSVDFLVLDPPYIHSPGKKSKKHMYNENYRNAETTSGYYWDDILDLYRKGLVEAKRVLRPDGFILVKSQNQVMSGQQRWAMTDIQNVAEGELGLYSRDMFILQTEPRRGNWSKQLHARKNWSFLWVFENKQVKLDRRRRRQVEEQNKK